MFESLISSLQQLVQQFSQQFSQPLSLSMIVLLLIVGVLFGLINTIAGGGSVLTLPALMLIGLEPHAANATNRVGGAIQTLSAAFGFWKRGAFKGQSLGFLIFYALLGGTLGPWLSLQLSQKSMGWVIQGCLILIALFTLFAPKSLFKDPPPPKRSLFAQHLGVFLVSLYGGFLQAGIGLVSLYYLRFVCGYDLVKGTAVKAVYLCALTLPTLIVFMWYGQVRWGAGILLAIGGLLGAAIGVRLSLSSSGQQVIRKALPITAIMMIIGLILRSV